MVRAATPPLPHAWVPRTEPALPGAATHLVPHSTPGSLCPARHWSPATGCHHTCAPGFATPETLTTPGCHATWVPHTCVHTGSRTWVPHTWSLHHPAVLPATHLVCHTWSHHTLGRHTPECLTTAPGCHLPEVSTLAATCHAWVPPPPECHLPGCHHMGACHTECHSLTDYQPDYHHCRFATHAWVPHAWVPRTWVPHLGATHLGAAPECRCHSRLGLLPRSPPLPGLPATGVLTLPECHLPHMVAHLGAITGCHRLGATHWVPHPESPHCVHLHLVPPAVHCHPGPHLGHLPWAALHLGPMRLGAPAWVPLAWVPPHWVPHTGCHTCVCHTCVPPHLEPHHLPPPPATTASPPALGAMPPGALPGTTPGATHLPRPGCHCTGSTALGAPPPGCHTLGASTWVATTGPRA
ncbi:hypothetical protein GPJ56_007239 [Histomonas meleagridis]|nr:hypothetical protein GPJ56_007239 [Histomonas meleagridis]